MRSTCRGRNDFVPLTLVLTIAAILVAGPLFAQGMGTLTLPDGDTVVLGLKPTPDYLAPFFPRTQTETFAAFGLPSSVDLSAQMPPVGNQGMAGSCASWATAYYYKAFQEGKERGWDFRDETQLISPAFVYNLINRGSTGGTYFFSNFDVLTQKGACTWDQMPYVWSDPSSWPSMEAWLDAMPNRAASYAYMFMSNHDASQYIDDMKAHLAGGDALVIGIPVYSDFSDWQKWPDYVYDGPSEGASNRGGHGICIVGYDDNKGTNGAFKFINSWGENWGDGGYAWLSYDFVGEYAMECWTMTDREGYVPMATAEIHIDHPERRALTVRLSAGGYSYTVLKKQGGSVPNIDMFADITDGLSVLPPTEENVWTCEVIDSDSDSIGQLTEFAIHYGGATYPASELPVAIPDMGSASATVTGGDSTNHLPSVDSVALSPDPAYTDDTLIATPGGWSDADGDPEGYHWHWERLADGAFAWQVISGATSDRLAASYFNGLDKIRVICLPWDGKSEGQAVTAQIEISNTPPTQPTVAFDPAAPGSSEDLVVVVSDCTDADGHSVSYSYRWYRNGTHLTEYDDASVVPAAATSRGETWRCVVTPSDGTDTGPSGEAQATIGNGAPSQPTVAISPASPTASDSLTVSATGSVDPDGDTVSYIYRWYRNDQHQSQFDDVTTIPASATSDGEIWACVVTPTDGSREGPSGEDRVGIGNARPSVESVAITPDPAYTDNTLTATPSGWDDADGDSADYHWRWEKRAAGTSSWTVISGAESHTLGSSNFARDDDVRVVCIPWDGVIEGDAVTDSITISNSPPTTPSVTITPEEPTSDEDLTVSVSGSSDADGDSLSYSYRWLKNGEHQPAYDDQTTIPASATSGREVWRCEVTVSDGTDTTDPVGAEVQIANSPPSIDSVTITPDPAYSHTDLVAVPSGWDDADGDEEDYVYQWQIRSRNAWYDIDGGRSATLSSDNFERGDRLRVMCVPWDGTDMGRTAMDEIIISNSPPTQPTVDVTPNDPDAGDDLRVAASGSTDPDGDAVSYSYRWLKDGAAQSEYDDATTIPASTTSAGETWKCVVTPTDGTDTGTPGEDQVTIGGTSSNSPPTQPTVDVTPDTPVTGDDLTVTASGSTDPDGDAVSYSYRWLKDGEPQDEYEDATTIPASATAAGETWKCVVTPTDGTDSGPSAQDAVTIANSPPTQPTVDVTPNDPDAGDDLRVIASGSTDPDGDAVSYSYRWLKDGAAQSEYDDATTIPASATSAGETWKCVVTPTDGTDSGPAAQDAVTIGRSNTAPTVEAVKITPDPARTGDQLVATPSGWHDPDGDPEGYKWEWRIIRDGTWEPVGGVLTSTLSAEYFAKDDRIRVICTPWDGEAAGDPVTDEIVIANTAPSAPAIRISPSAPGIADALHAIVTGGEDPDQDTLTTEVQWSKSTDGGATWSDWGWTGETLPASVTATNERWRARARLSDGEATSPWAVSDPVSIGIEIVRHRFEAGADLVSVPIEPSDPSRISIFGDNPVRSWTADGYIEPETILCGRGYWVKFGTPEDVAIAGRLAGDIYTVAAPTTGWQALGNPFDEPLAWSAIEFPSNVYYGWLYNKATHGYKLLSSSPTTTNEIPAWAGFWVSLPVAGDVTMSRQTTTAAQPAPSLEPQSDSDWRVGLTASVSGAADTDNFIGVLEGRGVAVPNPPVAAGRFVDLAVTGENGQMNALDIRGRAERRMVWNVVVSTNAADSRVTVSWPDLSGVPQDYSLVLTDEETGQSCYMRTTGGYSFPTGADGASRHLRIEAVRNDGGALAVSGVTTSRAGEGVTITYTLSAPASVNVEVLNIAGRTVRNLRRDAVTAAGADTVVWNLTSEHGSRVPQGMYLCRVTARTEDGQSVSVMRPVQVNR